MRDVLHGAVSRVAMGERREIGGHVEPRAGRQEDLRLLTGRGRFVADIALPGMLEMAVLRSPHAHARLGAIDASRARATPGVMAVVTSADLGEAGRPIPPVIPHPGFVAPRGPLPLAKDEVRYVGEPVAAVLAENRYLAEDALDGIAVAYEVLPIVSDLDVALRPDARVHADVAGNCAGRWTVATGDVDAALAQAARVIRERFTIERGHGQPLETRGVVVQWDARDGVMTIWTSTQLPHPVRDVIAAALQLPATQVRVVVPDVGGGFGLKGAIYPEELVAAALARQFGRPVRWIEDRREHFVASMHDRVQINEVEAAVDRSGRLIGLKHRVVVDLGAYVMFGFVVGNNVQLHIPGPYAVPNIHSEMVGLYTNRTPTGPWRGAGRPQANFIMERVMDRIAAELGLDPVEVRSRNLIPSGRMPYATGLKGGDGRPVEYDSGDYPALLERALAEFGYAQKRNDQRAARAAGRLYGIGVCCSVESSGGGPPEGATVRVTPDGRVAVAVGSPAQGQGHQTALSRIVARELGIDPALVSVVGGDTALIPRGMGTFGSRSLMIAGSAALLATREVREKMRRGEMELVATSYFAPSGPAWSSGAVACAVEIDRETAQVRILDYVAAHDSGTVLNPDLAEGQIVGGVANGVGNTLYERLVYDEQGQLLTGTFMDYLLPTAAEAPRVRTTHLSHPSPRNPLGVKGVGEGGIIPVASVLAQAIEDALEGHDVKITRLPILPETIFAWLARPADAVRAASS